MLQVLKKWFGNAAALPPRGDWRDVMRWAEAQGCQFRHVRNVHGFVIDGRIGATAWRLEWGPSQRTYVHGQELRLRADLHVPPDLQALILNRELQDAMERDVFDQYVEGVQTRVDTRTPPEMRWLVMFPKLSGQESRVLREHWTAVSSIKPWVERWVPGPLSDALTRARSEAGGGEFAPTALVISRSRLTLRTALDEPDRAAIVRLFELFQIALREAQRASAEFSDAAAPSTQPSMWDPSMLASDRAVH